MAQINYQKNITANITEFLRRTGMTQANLAEALGYSDKSISKWERGVSHN